jgi:hypothetical protein
MMHDGQVPLPHGARGIEAGDLAIEFRPEHDKLVLFNRSSQEHYTIHFGKTSGVFDIHRTWTDEVGRVRHQTLFAMRHEAMAPFISELGFPLVSELFRLLRPLRIGWLARHNIGVVKGIDPITDEEIAAITRRVRRRRLVIDAEQLEKNAYAPEFLEELRTLPDGAFSLIDCNRNQGTKIGVGFKNTDPFGKVQLQWLRLRDVSRLFNSTKGKFIDIAQRYSMPASDYASHSFLEQ